MLGVMNKIQTDFEWFVEYFKITLSNYRPK
ncbi:MAG: hypothetical protein ACI9EQ_000353 [Bacteroidia bacterium]|jgi:hypothetical protein